MITSKEIAEKIHMFYNLLYHLDDYIKNKKERKGQLRVSKNIRLILREIISSKINLNYFMNKRELDSYKDLNLKTNDDIVEKSKKYIVKINPLSLNQKNLNTINLFYDSGNEVYILNYLILEKIFSVIRFCFMEIVKKKNKECIEKLEKKFRNEFILYHRNDEREFSKKDNRENDSSNKFYNLNNTIKNNNTFGINSYKNRRHYENINYNKIKEITNNYITNNFNLSNIFNNNNSNLNGIIHSPNNNNSFKVSNNSINDLRIQLNKINNQMNLTSMKNNSKRTSHKNGIKKNISLPLIKENKKLNLKLNEKNKLNQNESIKSNNKFNFQNFSKVQINKTNILFNVSQKNNGKRTSFSNDKNLKFLEDINLSNKYNYKNILSLYNISKKFPAKKDK